MRVTGNSITANLVSQLNMLAARQARLQNQVATGQRIALEVRAPAKKGKPRSKAKGRRYRKAA